MKKQMHSSLESHVYYWLDYTYKNFRSNVVKIDNKKAIYKNQNKAMLVNSCFISYRHLSDNYELPKFIEQFHKVLNAQLIAEVKGGIYLDKRRMKGGDFVDESLAKALCESGCMIMIFCPLYFDNENLYCTREFLSMERLEKFRKHYYTGNKGLIIPIIYKNIGYYKSKNAINNRECYDFSNFGLWGGADILKSKEMNLAIREMAKSIAQQFRDFKNTYPMCEHDGKHEMVSEAEARKWLKASWDDSNEYPNEKFPFDEDND
ncbi:toll/interleukin-1 receptor domain-containing protein [Spirosoma taeanense]|uniref:Toll/interleukin-1 receptor domain-containing protein n=1 Tax=Spirosoma taeanense TaxID=2735870 RepID=A0A6M5YBZ1_9BACT|nr:toll/interleukin-1 receptor domain-containing protein [Spirosoma taeanense]QJW90826.1 toll/interleukin-1 receptor domain-containing protein [Spirosoma taeanense]